MKALLLALGLLAQLDDETPRAIPFVCVERSEVLVLASVMARDSEGDRWVRVRHRPSGQIMLGWISHIHGRFCWVAVGHPR